MSEKLGFNILRCSSCGIEYNVAYGHECKSELIKSLQAELEKEKDNHAISIALMGAAMKSNDKLREAGQRLLESLDIAFKVHDPYGAEWQTVDDDADILEETLANKDKPEGEL